MSKKPVEPDNEASSTTNLKFYQGDKPRKLRYTHYIETARIILDSIEAAFPISFITHNFSIVFLI